VSGLKLRVSSVSIFFLPTVPIYIWKTDDSIIVPEMGERAQVFSDLLTIDGTDNRKDAYAG
jgi:hypothetical protein